MTAHDEDPPARDDTVAPLSSPATAPAPVTHASSSQVASAVASNAAAWREAYLKAFEVRRRAIFNAVAAQRLAARADFAKVLPAKSPPPAGAPAEGGTNAAARPRPAPSGALSFSVQVTRAIEVMIAEYIVDSLKGMIADEVRLQLAQAPAAGTAASLRDAQEGAANAAPAAGTAASLRDAETGAPRAAASEGSPAKPQEPAFGLG